MHLPRRHASSRGLLFAILGAALAATAFADGRAQDANVERKVDALLRRADLPDAPDRLESALVELGSPAAARLAALLAEPADGLPVAPLARALARLDGRASLDRLARLARSPREGDRSAAIAAIAEVPVAEAMALVVPALDDESPLVADAAAEAIGVLAGRNPKLALLASLCPALAAVRDQARVGSALGKLGTPAAHDLLRKMLSSLSDDVASAALDGLWSLGTSDDLDGVRTLLRARRRPALRKKACLLVGRLSDGASVPDLIDALREEDAGLAANACWSLRAITGCCLDADAELWNDWWTRGGGDELARADENADEDADGAANVARTTDETAASDAARAAPPAERATRSAAPAAARAVDGGMPLSAIAVVALLAGALVLVHRRLAERLIRTGSVLPFRLPSLFQRPAAAAATPSRAQRRPPELTRT